MKSCARFAYSMSVILAACPGQTPRVPDASPAVRADAARAGTEAGPGPAKTVDSGAVPVPQATPQPSAPPAVARSTAPCALEGLARRLPGVVTADVAITENGPVVVAVVERPRAKRMAMESETVSFPDLRALVLIAPRAGGDEMRVVKLTDDPGPIHDPFRRLAYERLASTSVTCDVAGCLVATTIERLTPGTTGAAFTTMIHLLDEALDLQGEARWLPQEPDRGETLSACAGVTSSGYVLATAAQGGRGRILWLDRRGTPLMHRFLAEGFSSCTAWPAGPDVDIATEHAGGITFVSIGAEPAPDGGPGPWRPAVPEAASRPVLVALRGTQALFWSDDSGVHVSTSSRDAPSSVRPERAQWQHAALSGDGVLLATVDQAGGTVGVTLLDADLSVVAGGSGLARARRVWALGREGSSDARLAWLDGTDLTLDHLACPSSAGAASAPRPEPATMAQAADLESADRAAVAELRSRARAARDRDESFRAAWLLERVYELAPTDHESMVSAAGLLAEIRYSLAAQRMLEQVSLVEDSAARAALHQACVDRDFQRLWTAGEFQRITGCAAPAAAVTAPDAGIDASSPFTGEAPF